MMFEEILEHYRDLLDDNEIKNYKKLDRAIFLYKPDFERLLLNNPKIKREVFDRFDFKSEQKTKLVTEIPKKKAFWKRAICGGFYDAFTFLGDVVDKDHM